MKHAAVYLNFDLKRFCFLVDYVCVMDLGLFELSLRSSDGKDAVSEYLSSCNLYLFYLFQVKLLFSVYVVMFLICIEYFVLEKETW